MKVSSLAAVLACIALLAGCAKEAQKPADNAPAEQPSAPQGQPAPAAQPEPEPQTVFGKAIRSAENVSKQVGQRAAETADYLAQRSAEALEKLKALTREDVDAWLAERRRDWDEALVRIQEKARQKGNEAEPSVRQAMERLKQAREAAERKALELKNAAATELPRLRRELEDAWRRVRSEEEKAEQTVDQTA